MRPLTHSAAIVLQAARKGYRHGFDIAEATGLAGGTVYPILRRLERDRLLTARWEPATVARREGRPPRRYYELTQRGEQALAVALERFHFLRPFAQALPAKGPS
ncbi:MAG TPA: helix-turn-helix transcriptional regulator [Thermoanaerobaculia bacterium]|nr:helix-turn-helix transcriptional regulator [Thermoanaerobaculia bacterium]